MCRPTGYGWPSFPPWAKLNRAGSLQLGRAPYTSSAMRLRDLMVFCPTPPMRKAIRSPAAPVRGSWAESSSSGSSPLPSRRKQAQLFVESTDAFLDRSTHRRGDPTRVPVEAQDTAKGLKPEGIGQPLQHFIRPHIVHDQDNDLPCQRFHTLEEPPWRPPPRGGEDVRRRSSRSQDPSAPNWRMEPGRADMLTPRFLL